MTRTNDGTGAGRRDAVYFEKERGVTRVEVTRGVAHVTVELPGATLAADRLALLQSLAAAGIPIFLIKLHPTGLSFALREEQVEQGARLLEGWGAHHTFLRDLGQVKVMAGAMRDLSGVMASIFEALVGAGIAVRQTGDAYNAVVALVAGADAARAAAALRDCFGLDAVTSASEDARR